MEANSVAGNSKPPEENVLTAPHKTFAVSTYRGNIYDS